MSNKSEELGTLPIGPLLRKQAVPASIGFLVMSIYGIVDTIFVGRWVGSLGIGAITVVMPITFLIASFGMAVGIGGASVISRAMGSKNSEKAYLAFGNQITLTLFIAISMVFVGSFLQEPVLKLFGGKGNILPLSKIYFNIVLAGVPFLAWAMMSNNVIRAEGKPKIAMLILIVPAVVNMVLDPILIIGFDMGIAGAAWATALSYVASALFALYFFLSGKSEIHFFAKNLRLKWKMVKEIFAIGGVTMARQGTISLLYIVLNNSLFAYGGEIAISVYGIINRVMMFINFPVIGITQGFIPIAGYNYGAEHWGRVRKVIDIAIRSGTTIALCIFLFIIIFSRKVAGIFTIDQDLIDLSGPALVIVFIATPLITIQLIGSAYFQAIGKALPALLLTLTKQGFFLIPLVLILPPIFGLNGIWYAFPIADILSATICYLYLMRAKKKLPIASVATS